jgi:hypothetical protein
MGIIGHNFREFIDEAFFSLDRLGIFIARVFATEIFWQDPKQFF